MTSAAIVAGALLELPTGGMLAVTDVGVRDHASGFGPTDYRAFCLSATLGVGDIVNTPWGACEVVAPPRRCRLIQIDSEGERISALTGTPAALATTVAAAKTLDSGFNTIALRVEAL
jgi:hypothetical protein